MAPMIGTNRVEAQIGEALRSAAPRVARLSTAVQKEHELIRRVSVRVRGDRHAVVTDRDDDVVFVSVGQGPLIVCRYCWP